MENPYRTPKSDVDKDHKPHRSLWWKAYFFIIVPLSFWSIFDLLNAEGAGLIEIIEFIFMTIATFGLFGFVFSKKIFRPGFWIPFLVAYVLTDLSYGSLSSVDLQQGLSDKEYMTSIIIGFLLCFPEYYALYRLGDKNSPIWNAQREDVSPE